MRHAQLSPGHRPMSAALSRPGNDVRLRGPRPGQDTPSSAQAGPVSLKECVSKTGQPSEPRPGPRPGLPTGPALHRAGQATGDIGPAAATLQLLHSNIKLGSTPKTATEYCTTSKNTNFMVLVYATLLNGFYQKYLFNEVHILNRYINVIAVCEIYAAVSNCQSIHDLETR